MKEIVLLVQKRKPIFLMRQVLQAFLFASGLSDLGFSTTDVRSNAVSLKKYICKNMSKRKT